MPAPALAETFRFAATNGDDRTVRERWALALADARSEHERVSVVRYRFDPLERLPHDPIDAPQRCGAPSVVHPVLVALMEKREPPSPPPAHGPCHVEPPDAGR